MKRLEEEATPHFLALADAAKDNTGLSLRRAEAKCFARRMQVLALTHELTARGPRISNSTMGMRLRNGDALRDAQVWLARSQDDLEIQVRQAHLAISLSPIVRPGDTEHLSLMLALSWFHLSVLMYIAEVPGQRAGPTLAVDRWTTLWPCGAAGVEYPPMVALSTSELNATVSGQAWLPLAWNRGVRGA
jgi:hypothetical protein